jgi:hypothetical protein
MCAIYLIPLWSLYHVSFTPVHSSLFLFFFFPLPSSFILFSFLYLSNYRPALTISRRKIISLCCNYTSESATSTVFRSVEKVYLGRFDYRQSAQFELRCWLLVAQLVRCSVWDGTSSSYFVECVVCFWKLVGSCVESKLFSVVV